VAAARCPSRNDAPQARKRVPYRRLDDAWRSRGAITLSVGEVDHARAANRHLKGVISAARLGPFVRLRTLDRPVVARVVRLPVDGAPDNTECR
jgi:hypothetical protein